MSDMFIDSYKILTSRFVLLGNRSKALRFLQKGQEVDALPRELLDAAVTSLKAGQMDLTLTVPPTGHGEWYSQLEGSSQTCVLF